MGVKKILVSHKRSACIGCGSCAFLAPKNWTMNDDDGKSDLVDGEVKNNQIIVASIDEADRENNKEAAEACPVHCIKLN